MERCKCGEPAVAICHWCEEPVCEDCLQAHVDGYCVADEYAAAYEDRTGTLKEGPWR